MSTERSGGFYKWLWVPIIAPIIIAVISLVIAKFWPESQGKPPISHKEPDAVLKRDEPKPPETKPEDIKSAVKRDIHDD